MKIFGWYLHPEGGDWQKSCFEVFWRAAGSDWPLFKISTWAWASRFILYAICMEYRVWFFIAWSIALDCLIKSEERSTMGSHHATWDEMEVMRQINRSHILKKQPILESFYWLCWWSNMILRKIACDEYLNVNVMMITVSQYTKSHP